MKAWYLDGPRIALVIHAASVHFIAHYLRRNFCGRAQRRIDSPRRRSDLVVLDGDPSKDVTAFARVRLTVRGGRTI
jgi:hypothetical protein